MLSTGVYESSHKPLTNCIWLLESYSWHPKSASLVHPQCPGIAYIITRFLYVPSNILISFTVHSKVFVIVRFSSDKGYIHWYFCSDEMLETDEYVINDIPRYA